MKNWSLVLFLFTGMLSAQMNRFVYQASMKNNAHDKEKIKTELFYLDIDPETQSSEFYSKILKDRDSVIAKMRETKNFNREAMENYRDATDYRVSKNWKDKTTNFKKRIARDNYEYVEDRTMKWTLTNESTKIGQYSVQKATTEFAGRNWTAWFTNEIPFQEGPYKFKDLPGLIIKVEDKDGDYSFDLMESKKLSEKEVFNTRGQTVKVKRNQFENQLLAYNKDPLSFVNAALSQRRGNFKPSPEMIKQFEERAKKEAESESNPLELLNINSK